jgi:hypothetical protein
MTLIGPDVVDPGVGEGFRLSFSNGGHFHLCGGLVVGVNLDRSGLVANPQEHIPGRLEVLLNHVGIPSLS